ncbi:hypothetical protein MVG78_08335 [Roseomonas gilardii subsp. gilardii]|uniref:hypothetical protein n=1 Tax=Roseomonas gilardii TaxID=257708 RepID=UPI001FFB02A9|nr:hypothetical protein [Roseomonas gilardii]UPG74113.1 hypothetical protein MVG78_08335 [Roseomonas gilardii subsp. gilardii]
MLTIGSIERMSPRLFKAAYAGVYPQREPAVDVNGLEFFSDHEEARRWIIEQIGSEPDLWDLHDLEAEAGAGRHHASARGEARDAPHGEGRPAG